jgi:thiosulfate/3-mercaptopyruvate sulfurtransferase
MEERTLNRPPDGGKGVDRDAAGIVGSPRDPRHACRARAGESGFRAATALERQQLVGLRYQFVDCRWELGNPERGRELYLAGHIPGASFLDVDTDLSSPPGTRGRHPLPEPGAFARAAGAAGIGDGVFVVAYGSMGGAERLWWLLRHFGHDDCAVVDFDAWRGPLSSGVEEVEPAEFTARPRNDDTIEADELDRRSEELVVVDARVPSRWRGEPGPIDRVPGRIPGALNSPWNEPLLQLPDGELVVYCGSGVTACAVLHRLHLAGREAKLYPGSWSEWEQLGLPVERDEDV